MRIRTAQTLRRLALVAGLCAGAWLAAEGLDHGTARADEVPIRTEQPGGLLDILDDVLPEPPARPTPRSDPDPQPEPEPEQTEEPDRPRGPIEDILDDVGEVVTPDPADGDDGRPQHPVDTPPGPGPAPTQPPAIELPVDPGPQPTSPVLDVIPPAGDSLETNHPPFGGHHVPAPYVPVDDPQTGPRWGEPVCGSREGRGTPVTDGPPGTRDRLTSPRGSAGPGPQFDVCDLAAGGTGGQPPLLKPPSNDPAPGAPPGAYWLPHPDRAPPGHDQHDDTAPPSRHIAWPPGPG
ncbi:hypothetical protein ACQEVC_45300 [Plantactinospora sp. CA-294935]|uniref:hypothetical protein n=1 Tax=Plantactinospora sp. CA-294935 TaxID=3240012 RepID=UPI003D930D53